MSFCKISLSSLRDYATTTLLGTNGDSNGACLSNSNCNYGIKHTYKGSNTAANIGAYWWNNDGTSSGTNTWGTSELNTVNLNTNFITNIGSIWTEKIATTTWKVGGNTYDIVSGTKAADAYTNEYTSPVANTTETRKIGLMYVSDYGFAASPSAWTRYLYSYDNSSITVVNWMYMGLIEWTVVPQSGDTSTAFNISDGGYVIYNSVGYSYSAYAVRPVFYLNSDVKKIGNNIGSKTDPIRID